MKKLFCILLSCILVVNSVSRVYADADSTARSSFNPYEQFKKNHPNWFDSNGNYIPSGNSCLSTIIAPALIRAGETSGEIVSSLVDSVVDIIKSFNNSNGDVSVAYDDKGVPVTAENYNENNFYLTYNNKFCNYFNQKLQDKVHALDGYYLVEPTSEESPQYRKIHYSLSDKAYSNFLSLINGYTTLIGNGNSCNVLHSHELLYIGTYTYSGKTRYSLPAYDVNTNSFSQSLQWANPSSSKLQYGWNATDYSSINDNYNKMVAHLSVVASVSYGQPFKVFYSKDAVVKYISNNQQRTYAPKLPSGGFKINIKYINNSVNYPDINVNLDSLVGKVETDVQTDLDLTLKNYVDHLADFTDGGGTTNPTPTPSGGGSGGDFGDGTTPTPKPDFSDGSLTDTNTLLQKILDKLTEFSANHDKLAKTITDYIEKNDGKLEEILLAIQALSDGKTETEQNGCKYDFTVLSKYLTDLWNNSDKKFDEMVKLLEENNKYQQKLVDSLNEIKALLIADTVMDFFKDRSQETAEKAKDKFPTSIPWDISLVLNSMSAEPKNPKFSLPIKIESFKINETIDIDLSTDEWEKLAKTCRYILSVTFILFLIHLSRKLFSNGGDD